MKKTETKKLSHLIAAAGFITAISVLTMTTACDTESANAVGRLLGFNVSGIYTHDTTSCPGQDRFVTANSGKQVISFDLRQTGDNLEAIDNNGIIFRGTISDAIDSNAPFTLNGSTTIGNAVTVSGSIEINGSEGVMRATWIEDTLFSSLCGKANGVSSTPEPEIVDEDGDGVPADEDPDDTDPDVP